VLPSYRASEFPPSPICTEWRVESLSLITVAGPCRTHTGFPFMPLRAPRILLKQVVQQRIRNVNGMTNLTVEAAVFFQEMSMGGPCKISGALILCTLRGEKLRS